MKILLLVVLITITSVFASDNDITHRFPSFAHQGAKAVFVDFEEAHYDITYDINSKRAEVTAQIKIFVPEQGFPVFDLVANPTMIKVDGIIAGSAPTITPSNETKVRVINKLLNVGRYELEIKCPLENLVEFKKEGVKSAFWVTDLEDRAYLERYIPVSFEYDRVKMSFEIHFKGLLNKQHIFTNGYGFWIGKDRYSVTFPDYFTINSLYFHTTPVDSVEILQSYYKSKSGRDIPVKIYMASGSYHAQKTLLELNVSTQRVLAELESDYGTFPHPSLTIYNANLSSMGLSGMEYAGATVTNKRALSHEIFHSYFARGVTPANGNAGWIDEALAMWRDNGYYQASSLTGSSGLASHPMYTRKTDTNAYNFGPRFIAFLHNKFADKGGLKPFLARLLEKKLFVPIYTEDFIHEMETFYGESLMPVFQNYVFDKTAPSYPQVRSLNHRKLTLQELKRIL